MVHKTRCRIYAALPVLLCLMGVLCLAQTLAVPACAAITPAQAQQAPEGKFIQALGDKAIDIAKDKSLTTAQEDDRYRALLNEAFDMKTIGAFAIGRAWLHITPEQKREYLELFKDRVLKIYGGRMRFYNGEKFQVTDVRPQNDRDAIVSSRIMHIDGSAPTPMDWTVRREKNGTLAIIDVSVAGVSQSVTQRAEFSSILLRNNDDFNVLLDAMRQNAQQSQTAMRYANEIKFIH